MKILLVDDSDDKAFKIINTLNDALYPEQPEIARAMGFKSAVDLLSRVQYDMLILDLYLPINDGGTPTEMGGLMILNEILKGAKSKHPSHIICLTEYENIAQEIKTDADKHLFHVVVYSDTDGLWKAPLSSKAQYIQARVRDSNLLPQQFNVNLAIVTSSPSVELREVNNLPGPFVGEYHQADALHYFKATWQTAVGRSLSVVSCAAPTTGMTAACVTACKVIDRWRPRYLVMTGITAGTDKKCKYGDIIVAEAAYDYGSGKIVESKRGERQFIPSHSQLRIDPELYAIVQRWERDQLNMDEIRKARKDPFKKSPKLRIGLFASGAAVVQSQDLVDSILQTSRKTLGLEMEAYAIFQAAYLARTPRPRVLVAKSISDFADMKKSDKWQSYAAFTSARFIYEFFLNATELDLDL